MIQHTESPQYLAAIDLGSNSFHMIIAKVEDGHIHILDNLKEMVRLGGGIDSEGHLSDEIKVRALACLDRFAERIRGFPKGTVAAVGTNTLRRTQNAEQFLQTASDVLGHPIEIIKGKEEARLIYLGVSHSLAADPAGQEKRFVMDIGGGSTELILGKGFAPKHLYSLEMGCVSMSQACFPGGDLSADNWKKASIAAHLKLRPVRHLFRKLGWDRAIGASGTIKVVDRIIRELGLDPYHITLRSLYTLKDKMIEAGHLKHLKFQELSSDRRDVFAGGLAILIATFEALRIERMQVSEGALREGLLYDRIGRIQNEDTRLKTVSSVQRRFHINKKHAKRVRNTAKYLFEQCKDAWGLNAEDAEKLGWACNLHEIGLAVSLSGYHKHSAYLLENADLPGFSLEEQDWMSVLVRCHRKKIAPELFAALPEQSRERAIKLCVLLRLASLLHRSRKDDRLPIKTVTAEEGSLALEFAPYELINHPLQKVTLEKEVGYLNGINFRFSFSS